MSKPSTETVEIAPEYRAGYQALWDWFGMGRASFLVLPRAFMHEMPDEWQAKMASLLEEWDATWDWGDCGFDGTHVSVKRGNKFVCMPEVFLAYRRPYIGTINEFRREEVR